MVSLKRTGSRGVALGAEATVVPQLLDNQVDVEGAEFARSFRSKNIISSETKLLLLVKDPRG
jgi:hypothetical protein